MAAAPSRALGLSYRFYLLIWGKWQRNLLWRFASEFVRRLSGKLLFFSSLFPVFSLFCSWLLTAGKHDRILVRTSCKNTIQYKYPWRNSKLVCIIWRMRHCTAICVLSRAAVLVLIFFCHRETSSPTQGAVLGHLHLISFYCHLAREENAALESLEPVQLFWKADKKSIQLVDEGSATKSFSFGKSQQHREKTGL